MLKLITLGALVACMMLGVAHAAELSLKSGESALIRANTDSRVTCNTGNSERPIKTCSSIISSVSCTENFLGGECKKFDGSIGKCVQTNYVVDKMVCECL